MDDGRLPERIEGDGLLIRRWRVEDSPLQHRAILDSVEHLRPWMAWVSHEPQSLEARRALIGTWEREWERGGDVYFAILLDGDVAGSTGYHRRIGPGGLEIGYWLHPAFTGRGIATRAARLLTDAAFAVDGIDRVEIRHDRANAASRAVPERLGYTLAGERPNARAAPGETGVDWIWRTLRTGSPPPASSPPSRPPR